MNGIVVLVDLVEFSEKPQKEQVQQVKRLSEWLDEALADSDGDIKARDLGYYLNSVGDGFLLAIEDDALETAEWALSLVRTLMRKANSYEPHPRTRVESHKKMLLRAALHKGEWVGDKVASFGGTHHVGKALNYTARLITAADPMTVVVSDVLRNALAETEFGVGANEDTKFPRFNPPSGGWDIPVKHNRVVQVYQFPGDSDKGKSISDKWLGIVERQDELLKLVKDELADLGSEIIRSLPGADLRPRLSVFVPDINRENMKSTQFRVKLPNNAAPQRTKTQYRIDLKKKWAQGPVGTAYVEDCSVIVTGLPNPHLSEEEYYKALVKKTCIDGRPLNLELGDVQAPEIWTRQAQGYICVPIRLRRGGTVVSRGGVVCIDTRDDLTKFAQSDLRDLSQVIRNRCDKYLAALIESSMK